MKGVFLAGVLPFLGGLSLAYILVKSAIQLCEPGELGLGDVVVRDRPPLLITIGLCILGDRADADPVACLEPAFFRRKAEVAPTEMVL